MFTAAFPDLTNSPTVVLWCPVGPDGLPTGVAVSAAGRAAYLPVRHGGGGNLDEELVRRWVRRELSDKNVYSFETKKMLHALQTWGVDLEAAGCRMHDVQYAAALIDENQHGWNLPVLAARRLGVHHLTLHREKVLPLSCEVSATARDGNPSVDIAILSSSQACPVAICCVRIVDKLRQSYKAEIESQDLQKVLDLEDGLLYAVANMERQGVRLDEEKLDLWIRETREAAGQRLLNIRRATGLNVDPNAPSDLACLYRHLGLSFPTTTAGHGSFKAAFLASCNHPSVADALAARQILALNSKLVAYRRALRGGRLYYRFYQLICDEGGTVSGRFSATDIQHVRAPDRQPKSTRRWLVRELFIPAPGKRWLRADASQIEFRLFAHFCRFIDSPRLRDAYRREPWLDFHEQVAGFVRRFVPGFTRDEAKRVTYEKLYGGGSATLADMLDVPLAQGQQITADYERAFPEARHLLNILSDLARKRGYIRTLSGRRRRLQDRYYAALNSLLQGSAADIMKVKLLRLYDARREIGLNMYFTVHDEVDGEVADTGGAERVAALLNEQEYALDVPVLWKVELLDNWKGMQP
jgi:DNA polymerase-1